MISASSYLLSDLDLDLSWGSQGLRNAELAGFIVLHTFQVNGIQFGEVMKEIKMDILTLLLKEIYLVKRNNGCFTDNFKTL